MVAALVTFLSLIAACLVFASLFASLGRRGYAAYAAGTAVLRGRLRRVLLQRHRAGLACGHPQRRGGPRLDMDLRHRGMAAPRTPRRTGPPLTLAAASHAVKLRPPSPLPAASHPSAMNITKSGWRWHLRSAAAPHRQLDRADRQLGGGPLAHGVADRQLGAALHDRDQVQRPLVGRQFGVIGVPQPVGLGGTELPVAQVGCRRDPGSRRVSPGRARRRRCTPTSPVVRSSRATRLRPTWTRRRSPSSAWTLGAP